MVMVLIDFKQKLQIHNPHFIRTDLGCCKKKQQQKIEQKSYYQLNTKTIDSLILYLWEGIDDIVHHSKQPVKVYY